MQLPLSDELEDPLSDEQLEDPPLKLEPTETPLAKPWLVDADECLEYPAKPWSVDADERLEGLTKSCVELGIFREPRPTVLSISILSFSFRISWRSSNSR